MGTVERRIETTGHTLEWMVYSLSDEQLQDPRVVKGVDFLATLMWDHPDYDWKIGPRGHALHALAMYDERVFGGRPGSRRVRIGELAQEFPTITTGGRAFAGFSVTVEPWVALLRRRKQHTMRTLLVGLLPTSTSLSLAPSPRLALRPKHEAPTIHEAIRHLL
jgi:hypothetical protein